MFRWMYVSQSTIQESDNRSEVDLIVDKSIQHNRKGGVTGALIFSGDRFGQIIEGPERTISLLRENISKDTRHSAITTLLYGAFRDRIFSNWSLAYSGQSHFFGSILGAVELGKDNQLSGSIASVEKLFNEFSADITGFRFESH